MTDIFAALAAPFPPGAIHWRAQLVAERNGTFSALALAYIDARDVMDRLDEVCTPAGWTDAYIETAKGRTIGTISIKFDGEWVSKTDGAGDTDVEGEKGSLSDALKRTAVKWGIGRYLYRLSDVWAECEVVKDREGKTVTNNKGKPQFKKWTAKGLRDLAAAVGGNPRAVEPVREQQASEPAKVEELTGRQLDALAKLEEAETLPRLTIWAEEYGKLFPDGSEAKRIAGAAFTKRKKAVEMLDRAAA